MPLGMKAELIEAVAEGGDEMVEPLLDEEWMGLIVLGRGEFPKIICLRAGPQLIWLPEECGRK